MNIAEMKEEVIRRIMQLETETEVEQLLAYLEEKEGAAATLHLARHYASIKEQYSDVLQKLAE